MEDGEDAVDSGRVVQSNAAESAQDQESSATNAAPSIEGGTDDEQLPPNPVATGGEEGVETGESNEALGGSPASVSRGTSDELLPDADDTAGGEEDRPDSQDDDDQDAHAEAEEADDDDQDAPAESVAEEADDDDDGAKFQRTKAKLEEDSAHARLGVLYLWRAMAVDPSLAGVCIGGSVDSIFASLDAHDLGVPAPQRETEEALAAAWEGARTGGGRPPSPASWAEDLVDRVRDRVRAAIGGGGVPNAVTAARLKGLATFAAQQAFEEAAPIVGSAVKLQEGLFAATRAFCERFGVWLSSRGVRLNLGHPKAIADAIKMGIDRSLLSGVYEIAKSSLTLSLHIVAAGAGVAVEAFAAIVEALVKIIWRISEVSIIRSFVEEAGNHWSNREKDDAIHKDRDKFSAWFQGVAERVPIIAGITYGSGIVGDKMLFLKMFSEDETKIISQKEFDEGVKHLEKVKESGVSQFRKSGIKFESSDKYVQAIIDSMSKKQVYRLDGDYFVRIDRSDQSVAARCGCTIL